MIMKLRYIISWQWWWGGKWEIISTDTELEIFNLSILYSIYILYSMYILYSIYIMVALLNEQNEAILETAGLIKPNL